MLDVNDKEVHVKLRPNSKCNNCSKVGHFIEDCHQDKPLFIDAWHSRNGL